MCNACGFLCCASDEFEGCGCDDCEDSECWTVCDPINGIHNDYCDCPDDADDDYLDEPDEWDEYERHVHDYPEFHPEIYDVGENSCRFPDRCLMPGPHIELECYTSEMIEHYIDEIRKEREYVSRWR